MGIIFHTQRRSRKKLFAIIWFISLTCTIIYNEYYTYMSNTSEWLEPKCTNEKDCTRVLLVADPQIIGYQNEILHFLMPLTIHDSDSYLKKTYKVALDFANPDIVVFLGDLMDEGSQASDVEFNSYVRRVFTIFAEQSNPHMKHIWLPGDNDIGGEGVDNVTDHKMRRFQRAFSQPDLIAHKNITFFKINRLMESIPVFNEKRDFYNTTEIFVGLSHVPLMFTPGIFAEKVFAKMQPQIFFTAHEHKSIIVNTNALMRQDRQIMSLLPDNNQVQECPLGVADLYEIIVPTCSYRMGTYKIGYGFAIFEKKYLRYTVLWSPSRFKQLFTYLTLNVIFLLFFLYIFSCDLCKYLISRM